MLYYTKYKFLMRLLFGGNCCREFLVFSFSSCFRSCLVNVRRFFAQRYSPFDMGDLRVLAPARRTRVRLRVAVLRKSPHLKRFRPATGRINAALALSTSFDSPIRLSSLA